MDLFINLKVNFRGNSKNFLLSGSEIKSWDSMEAMVRDYCEQTLCTVFIRSVGCIGRELNSNYPIILGGGGAFFPEGIRGLLH